MSHESHNRIHKKLKKHSPEGIKKAKKIFSFKYPKLFILIILILLAYYFFSRPFILEWIEVFNRLGYFGVFISGILTSLGFTTPFGIGLLVNIDSLNILFAAIIAGLGATVADLIIFKTIKFSFMDEFKKLEKTKAIREIEHIVKKDKHVLIRHYLMYIFAGIMIATPLPDELGISMLAGLTTIKPMKLALIGFILHSAAIFALLYFI
jgi:hypothetical protein